MNEQWNITVCLSHYSNLVFNLIEQLGVSLYIH